ncbi:sterol desaturase family protein [Hyphomonas johnsonii]|nr:sterol desaturase family protein [Hyphomonas johnsonii]
MAESALSASDALGIAQRVGQWLFDLLPVGTGDRTHWTGLAAFLFLGTLVYAFNRKSIREKGFTGLAAYLTPARIYLSRSSLLDVKVFLANKLFQPLRAVVSRGVQFVIVAFVADAVGTGLHPGTDGTLPVPMLFLAAFVAALAADFAYYVTHRFHHESPLLWPFHKLHHSAEHLTILTAKRNHPVFDLLLDLVAALFIAPVIGVIYGLFGMFDIATLFGISVFFAVFNLAGGALRHSHIWLDYGPVLDHIFISPAQHQVHHSLDPKHHDRNYGLMFALWDWAFGTLYIPQGREQLRYGVADANGHPEPQVHTSLVTAYAVPFTEAAHVLRQSARPAPAAKAGLAK